VSVDDFYATPAKPLAWTPAPAAPPAQHGVRRAPARSGPGWPVVAAIALAVVGALIAAAVALWPHSSGTSAPDPGMARLFGQQTRLQLPQPIAAEDCAAAVRAFPKIAADTRARAAFEEGCLHG
jgi:hypothetical protein